MDQKFTSFNEFWPYYLAEHQHPANRRLHFFGTLLAILTFALAIILGEPWLFALTPITGYLFAWIGHFVVEKNKPATFRHPVWSLAGDFKMFWLTLRGQLDAELANLNHLDKPREQSAD